MVSKLFRINNPMFKSELLTEPQTWQDTTSKQWWQCQIAMSNPSPLKNNSFFFGLEQCDCFLTYPKNPWRSGFASKAAIAQTRTILGGKSDPVVHYKTTTPQPWKKTWQWTIGKWDSSCKHHFQAWSWLIASVDKKSLISTGPPTSSADT